MPDVDMAHVHVDGRRAAPGLRVSALAQSVPGPERTLIPPARAVTFAGSQVSVGPVLQIGMELQGE